MDWGLQESNLIWPSKQCDNNTNISVSNLNESISVQCMCAPGMGHVQSKMSNQHIVNPKVVVENLPLQTLNIGKNNLHVQYQNKMKSDSSDEEVWPKCNFEKLCALEVEPVDTKRSCSGRLVVTHKRTHEQSESQEHAKESKELLMKKMKIPKFIVKGREMQAFFHLLSKQCFISRDYIFD